MTETDLLKAASDGALDAVYAAIQKGEDINKEDQVSILYFLLMHFDVFILLLHVEDIHGSIALPTPQC
jgi:hypothetical protein